MKRHRLWWIGIFVLSVGMLRSDGPPAPGVRLKLVGLQTRKRVTDDKGQVLFHPFTLITFTAESDAGGFLMLLPGDSKVRTLSDDLGTDLTKTPEDPDAKADVNRAARAGAHLSENFSAVMRGTYAFNLQAPGRAAEGAVTLRLEGELVFLTAGKISTTTVKDVEIRPGTKVDTGLGEMRVIALEKWPWPDAKGFGLRYNDPDGSLTRRLVGVRLVGPDGDEIGGAEYGTSQRGVERTRFFKLPEDVPRLTIELTCHDDVRRIKVPVEMTIGVGF